eukprot:TRINITY_DN22755_c0_g1_i1.p1 TRINITY_DN22755_c0_g1~~TRINITY_DN22755_c0_g1_i1.p1  ORF type:complete len:652 (-),score=115.86 TRINITY_DN22755_c0_g1_i1:99-1934(-)
MAVKAGHYHMSCLLVDHAGVPALRAATEKGFIPLHLAASEGHVDLARFLINGQKASANVKNSDGDTPLHLAIHRGHGQMARLLLSTGGAEVNSRNNAGAAPIHLATEAGNLDLVRLLIELGGSETADLPAKNGQRPLHLATSPNSHAEVAMFLIKSAASVSAETDAGETPLQLAVTAGNADLVHLLLTMGCVSEVTALTRAGLTLLHIAACHNHAETLQLLITCGGADINAVGSGGETALHMAALHGSPDAARVLINSGAEVDPLTREECTPLYVSVYTMSSLDYVLPGCDNNFLQVIELLLHSKAQPCKATRMGTSAMDVTAYFGQDNLTDLLKLFGGKENETYQEQLGHGQRRTARTKMLNLQNSDQYSVKTLEQLCVRMNGPNAQLLAVDIWHNQGVVVFPGLLQLKDIQMLKGHVEDARQRTWTTDRSGSIRSPQNRELKGISVALSSKVIMPMARKLAVFLERALHHKKQMLLESNVMITSPGAKDQDWHSDVPGYDDRLAAVQIALVDTAVNQGALEVAPGSHLTPDVPANKRPTIPVEVPAGSVIFYSPKLLHRGRANTTTKDRVTLTFNLLGCSGLLPAGVPYTMQPEDSWKWCLSEGSLLLA